ncbi:hypothetical protein CMI47_12825 [Candidatus Pacearchaeota archaeon]|nr:hypothetical protein [Candidatus Pacearchaeota archaeon]|tara:strand:+ start:49911 stop:50771 length:861 start_codon:yes stop_codon:yes gene_type:complete
MIKKLVKIVQKIFESIIDPPQKTLDQHVFSNDTLLTQYSRKQVNNALNEFLNNIKIFPKIEGIVIVGSILTRQWTENSDIDVGIIIDYDILIKYLQVNDRIEVYKYLSIFLQDVNNKYFINKHPINIYINDINDQIFKRDVNIYNFITNTWTKKINRIVYNPKEIQAQKDIVRKCIIKINNLISNTTIDIIDYKMLKHEISIKIDNHEQILPLCDKLHIIKKKLENDLSNLELVFNNIKYTRKSVLDKSNNESIPTEIRYKLYERYNILNAIRVLIKTLNMILLDN